MPYIPQRDRIALDPVAQATPETAGELNFMFTEIATAYLRHNGLNYQRINDIIGALEGCKLEMYRRVVGKYEDQKIAENGDVEFYSKMKDR